MGSANMSISIVGCGWLGLPLAENALDMGLLVKGSTTSDKKLPKLRSLGIDAYLLNLPGNIDADIALFQANYLVLNIPPGRRNPNVLVDYPASVARILRSALEAGQISKIIFVSSTSVYGDNMDFIDENTNSDPQSSSGEALVRAEQLIVDSGIKYNILRFGGLAGPGRHPGRFLAGRSHLSAGNQAINFLHLQDAIGAINCFLNHLHDDKIYNIVSPFHPTKRDFYTRMAKDLVLEPPQFDEKVFSPKREISPDKFTSDTGYQFIFPNPMNYQF
jgi:nucleoside-diphosphate-sugar epimerase